MEVEAGGCDVVVPVSKDKLVVGRAGTLSDFIFLTGVALANVNPVPEVVVADGAVSEEFPSDFAFVSLEAPQNNIDPFVLGGACVSTRALVFVVATNEKLV